MPLMLHDLEWRSGAMVDPPGLDPSELARVPNTNCYFFRRGEDRYSVIGHEIGGRGLRVGLTALEAQCILIELTREVTDDTP